MIEKCAFCNHPDLFATVTVDLPMLTTVRLDIAGSSCVVVGTRAVVTELLAFILVKVQLHGVVPLPFGLTHREKDTLPHNRAGFHSFVVQYQGEQP